MVATTLARSEAIENGGGPVAPGVLWLELPGENALECGDNGEGSRSAPVQLLARTGNVLEHWYWGPMVHDMDGMRTSRNRVLIDWRHDREHQLGYLNKFEIVDGDLIARGALTPFCDSDKSAEIAYKLREGVPYQASIEFGGHLVLEEVPAGVAVEVNGRTLNGPLTVFREWELEAVAICPFGYDRGTDCTALDGGQSARALTIRRAHNVAESQTQLNDEQPTEAPEAVEVANDSPQTEGGSAQLSQPVDARGTQLSEPEQRAALVRQFSSEFGQEHGQRYFLEGLTIEQARGRYAEDLRTENEQLRQRLEAITDAEPEPVDSAPRNLEQPKRFSSAIRIAGKRYDD